MFQGPGGGAVQAWWYRCGTARCPAATVLGDRLPVAPAVRDGVDVCPFCAHPLERLGMRGPTRSLRLALAGRTVAELVVEQGVGLVLGRWGGAGCVPLDEFVPAATVATVSRRHVRFDVAPLGLFVHDLGSANGTWLRLGASRVRLDPSVCVVVTDDALIELAGAVTVVPGGEGGHSGRSIASSADVTSDGTRLATASADPAPPPAPDTGTGGGAGRRAR